MSKENSAIHVVVVVVNVPERLFTFNWTKCSPHCFIFLFGLAHSFCSSANRAVTCVKAAIIWEIRKFCEQAN